MGIRKWFIIGSGVAGGIGGVSLNEQQQQQEHRPPPAMHAEPFPQDSAQPENNGGMNEGSAFLLGAAAGAVLAAGATRKGHRERLERQRAAGDRATGEVDEQFGEHEVKGKIRRTGRYGQGTQNDGHDR